MPPVMAVEQRAVAARWSPWRCRGLTAVTPPREPPTLAHAEEMHHHAAASVFWLGRCLDVRCFYGCFMVIEAREEDASDGIPNLIRGDIIFPDVHIAVFISQENEGYTIVRCAG